MTRKGASDTLTAKTKRSAKAKERIWSSQEQNSRKSAPQGFWYVLLHKPFQCLRREMKGRGVTKNLRWTVCRPVGPPHDMTHAACDVTQQHTSRLQTPLRKVNLIKTKCVNPQQKGDGGRKLSDLPQHRQHNGAIVSPSVVSFGVNVFACTVTA